MDLKEIAYKDRGEFLKGVFVIIRKNNCLNIHEKTMFLTIWKYLGFEKEFCEESSGHLTVNKYIAENPPIFSTEFIANSFIKKLLK